MKPVFKLEKWAVVYNVEHDPYTAPERNDITSSW
jgi:hypothetical protein